MAKFIGPDLDTFAFAIKISRYLSSRQFRPLSFLLYTRLLLLAYFYSIFLARNQEPRCVSFSQDHKKSQQTNLDKLPFYFLSLFPRCRVQSVSNLQNSTSNLRLCKKFAPFSVPVTPLGEILSQQDISISV